MPIPPLKPIADISKRPATALVARLSTFALTKQMFALVAVMVLMTSLLVADRANGVTKTWDGGCIADLDWSCALNWSDNAVPGPADAVTLDTTSLLNSTVDSGFGGTIASLTISSTYTGTLTLERSLQITGNFLQANGTFTAAGQTLDIDGSFTLNGGSFTASSVTTTLAGAMTITGSPNFTHNGGSWRFDSSTSATISCNNVSFNVVQISHTSGTKTFNNACSLPLGADPTITNAVIMFGTFSGSGTLTNSAGTLTLNSTSSLSGFNGLVASALIISGATYDFGSYGTFDANLSLTLSSSAMFTAPATMTVGASFTQNSGTTFNHNNGTVTFDTTTGTITCQGSPFNLVVLAAGSKTIASGCTVPLGTNPTITSGGTITVTGTLSGSGTITFPAAVTFNGSSPLSGFSGVVHNSSNFTIGSGGVVDLSSYTTVDINGSFILNNSGTFTAPSGTMTAATTFTHNSGGTFNHGNGLVRFDGGGGVITCQGSPFNNAEITTGTKTIAAGCTVPLGANPSLGVGLTVAGTVSGSGTLTFTAGTLTFSAGGGMSGFTRLVASGMTVSGSGTVDLSGLTDVDVNGTFTLNSPAIFSAPPLMTVAISATLNSGGTFTHNNGTVRFDGTSNGTVACNSISLYNVEFRHTAGIKTVSTTCNLPLGTDPTIDFSVTLQGTLSGSGTLTASGTTTLSNAAAAFSGFSTVSAGNLAVSGGITLDVSSQISTLDVRSNFTLSTSGTNFTPPAAMSVGGNFTVNSGTTFNHNNGTIILDGQNQRITPSVTFYNLTKTNSGTDYAAIRFDSGSTTTVLGTLTIKGNANAYIGLSLWSGSTAWTIDAQGARDIEYVVIHNGTASGTAITATKSLLGPGTANWNVTDPVSPAGNTIDFEDTTSGSGLGAHMTGVYSHVAAWGDVNNDGYIDLYIGSFVNDPAPEPNQLFLGGGGGVFTKSDQPVVEISGQASGAIFVDLDNDSDQDLMLSNYTYPGNADSDRAEPSHLFENTGNGTFEDISLSSGIRDAISTSTGRSVGVIDYNNDGYMDMIHHADALVGGIGTMKLVKNNGDMTFSNVTAAAGLPTDISGLGLAVGDANGDSWSDIVVSGDTYDGSANNFRSFRLYINNQNGTFRDESFADLNFPTNGGVDDWAAGAQWGDLNNDGRLDLVTGQHYESSYEISPLALRIFINKGNDSSGNPILDRMPIDTLVPIPAKQPHIDLQDFDNDGWVDIFTSVFTQVGSDLHPYVYRNSGILNGSGEPSFIPPDFDYIPPVPGIATLPYYSPGAPVGDYDNDGRLDILMEGLAEFATPTLWRNTTATANKWLKVKIANSDSNTQGFGSSIKVYSAGHAGEADYLIGAREITTGNGFSSAQSAIAHFGLGAASAVDIKITLPNNGGTVIKTNVPTDQLLTINTNAAVNPTPDTPSGPVADPVKTPSVEELLEPKAAIEGVVPSVSETVTLPVTGQTNTGEQPQQKAPSLLNAIAIGGAAVAAGAALIILVPQAGAAAYIPQAGSNLAGTGSIRRLGRWLLRLLGR